MSAPGQDAVILAYDVEHAPVAHAIAEAVYRAGAHYVSVLYWDQHVKRSRLEHADDESLGYTPAWWDRHIEDLIERRSATSWCGAIPIRTCSATSIRPAPDAIRCR